MSAISIFSHVHVFYSVFYMYVACIMDDVRVLCSIEAAVIRRNVRMISSVNVHATRPPTTATAADISPLLSQSVCYLAFYAASIERLCERQRSVPPA